MKAHWLAIKEQLLQGRYQPQAIKRVEIPKPGSQEKRQLGIPCVTDRLIQQAMLQVLQWRWDPTFSAFSYGFRPGRSAHQAVAQAQAYLEQGYSYVVDIDVEKFFDCVCHDRLMSRLAQRITDKRVLKLIRAFLQTGILEDGLMTIPTEGTPQGSPFHRFFPTWCWTSWTRNSRTEVTDFVGTRMIAISTCGVPEPGRACWRASVASSRGA